MHVVVITKSVPDTEATVTVDGSGNVSWGDKLVINPWDEYAITEAILLKGAHNVTATIMTIGPDEHKEALKHGLAIGCDQAIQVWDAALEGHDSLAYATAAAAAINKLGDVDLVIFGKELSDIASDIHVFQTARKLGWTALGSVAKIDAIDFGAKTIQVQRLVEQGIQVVTSQLPAVISVIKDINEPKYPTFIGIRKAAKADMPLWDSAELGLSADDLAAPVKVTGYRELPKREGAVQMIDGASAAEQAATLADKLLEEKVL
ncbi:MAG: electron transfer flavoprotein subunit beta/FixA family protein [Chloroflexi bacterium]|nr:electron transfer flavoprotein subunit beta/FixA family protein [Chloroflexota bacterium]